MRTTLSLESDVAKELKSLQERSGRPFKNVVNDVLRAGLTVLLARRQKKAASAYQTRPVSLGNPSLPTLDNIAEVLSIAEGDDRP